MCDDLQAQREFYRDTLGFVEIAADVSDGWVWFEGGWPNMFELQQHDDRPWCSRLGYKIGFGVEDIASARAALVEHGIAPLSDVMGGVEDQGWWAYFCDTEGNAFEITQRTGNWDRESGPLRWPIWIGVIGAANPTRHFDFYRDLTGWPEIARDEWNTWLDGGGPRLFEPLRIEEEAPYEAVRTQVGFEVDDVAATRARLVDAGVEAITEVRGGVESLGTWAYFRDPEGNVFSVNHRLVNPSDSV